MNPNPFMWVILNSNTIFSLHSSLKGGKDKKSDHACFRFCNFRISLMHWQVFELSPPDLEPERDCKGKIKGGIGFIFHIFHIFIQLQSKR